MISEQEVWCLIQDRVFASSEMNYGLCGFLDDLCAECKISNAQHEQLIARIYHAMAHHPGSDTYFEGDRADFLFATSEERRALRLSILDKFIAETVDTVAPGYDDDDIP